MVTRVGVVKWEAKLAEGSESWNECCAYKRQYINLKLKEWQWKEWMMLGGVLLSVVVLCVVCVFHEEETFEA